MAAVRRMTDNVIDQAVADICTEFAMSKYMTAHHRELALVKEIIRLRAIEEAAKSYYMHFLQDEADEPDLCMWQDQHEAAKALKHALRPITPPTNSASNFSNNCTPEAG